MKNFPYKIIDLTHELNNDTRGWDGACGFNHKCVFDYDPKDEYQFKVHQILMNEGIGTHMDSPAHCIADGKTIDLLPLSDLLASCAMIDVSQSSHERYEISVEDVQENEKQYGKIGNGDFVMLRTGWETRWPLPELYNNNHVFPSLSADAAELLLERGISGVGIDTLSPDRPDNGFPVHKMVLGAGKHILENAANLVELRPRGSFILIAPLKIHGGTEAPVRLIGFNPLEE